MGPLSLSLGLKSRPAGGAAAPAGYTLRLNLDGSEIVPIVSDNPPVGPALPDIEVGAISEGPFGTIIMDDLCFYARALSDVDTATFIGGGIPSSPAFHLNFENADLGLDASGNGYNFATIPTVNQVAGFNGAGGGAQTDGLLGYLGADPTNVLAGLDLSGGGFSVCGRFKPSQADMDSGFATIIAARGGDNASGTWGIDVRGANLIAYIYVGGAYVDVSKSGVTADTWHSFVFRLIH